MTFYAVEVETYIPGHPARRFDWPHGSHPHGARGRRISLLENTELIRASDTGYRTRTGEAGADTGAVQVYPALLQASFALDRSVTLPPNTDPGSTTVGALSLVNFGRFDDIAQTQNSDARSVRVLVGQKTPNSAGVLSDPPYSELELFWSGTAQSWQLAEDVLSIPLRDPLYLLQRQLQQALYAGTGGLEGTVDLKGKPKPMLRGAAQNITPILLDATNLIYQISDAPGSITAVSEGGDTGNIAAGGQVDDITANTPGAGHWIYESSTRGLFMRLATKPVYAITVDASGEFPSGNTASTALALVFTLLIETLGLSASRIDGDAFTAADTARPYQAGFWYGTDNATCADAIGALTASVAAKLIAGRDGLIRPFVLRALPDDATPSAEWTTAQIVSCTPQTLPSTLDPPPAAWNVGYARNYTVMTSDLDPDVTGTDRQTYLANEYRRAGWLGSAVALAWRSANWPDTVGGQLINQADAQTVANELGALWAVGAQRRRLYSIVLPDELARGCDIGDAVRITYPLDVLRSGATGLVVGETFRSTDNTTTVLVLV